MTRDELLQHLRGCFEMDDREAAHWAADMALLEYIGDGQIEAAYEALDRWYA